MSDRTFMGGAKAVAYSILFVAACVTLVRGVVGPLWGAANDFGVFGAVAAGALGILGLAWLASVLVRDVAKHFQPDSTKETTVEE